VEIRGLKERPLNVDAMDANGRVAVEFVSARDYFDLGGQRSGSTVQGYHFKGLGQSLADKARGKGRGIRFGVFYDPMARLSDEEEKALPEGKWEERWKKRSEVVRARSFELLREQVKDFVDWLKAQGAM
jgi:hypothetical protein